MEKRTCKLCYKTFSNGRALGGHMRSHMVKLQTSPPLPLPPPPPPPPSSHHLHLQLEDGTESTSTTSSSSCYEEDDKGLSYGLRENPKKSFRLVDPEFSSFVVVDAGSVVQDRESETESSKNLSRRRSKRNRKSGLTEQHLQNQEHELMMMMKKQQQQQPPNKLSKSITIESQIEPEPVSSVSDTTPEEDVAWCLMMLSRGIRTRKREVVQEVEEEEEEQKEEEEEEEEGEEEEEEEEKSIEESDEELEEIKIRVKRSRGKYQCGTCKKFFRSYQALGGHRASHKKIKGCNITTPSSSSVARLNQEAEYDNEGNVGSTSTIPNIPTVVDRRIHECPVCFRVFGSGQALGGHKRSHITGSTSTIQQPIRPNNNSTRFNNNLIDLNLPAPMEDEDQIELSAVSDVEFIR